MVELIKRYYLGFRATHILETQLEVGAGKIMKYMLSRIFVTMSFFTYFYRGTGSGFPPPPPLDTCS